MTQHIGPEVSITAPDSVAGWCVLPALTAFQRQFPHIACRLQICDESDPPLTQQADVTISNSPGHSRIGVFTERLASDQWRLFASEKYVQTYGLPRSVRELDAHNFVVGSDSLERLRPMKTLIDRLDPGNVALRCNNMPALQSAVLSGLGIGLLPDYVGWSDERLVPAPINTENSFGEIWLIVDDDKRVKPEIAAMINCVKDHV